MRSGFAYTPFGNNSGHVSLFRYIQSCRELVSLDLPIVAERTGTIGLALVAFGAVSGLESGVTSATNLTLVCSGVRARRAAALSPPACISQSVEFLCPRLLRGRCSKSHV